MVFLYYCKENHPEGRTRGERLAHGPIEIFIGNLAVFAAPYNVTWADILRALPPMRFHKGRH